MYLKAENHTNEAQCSIQPYHDRKEYVDAQIKTTKSNENFLPIDLNKKRFH